MPSSKPHFTRFSPVSTRRFARALALIALATVGCSSGNDGGSNDVGPIEESGRLEGITAAHNAVRAEADSSIPPLVWDEELAGVAQSWANRLRDNGCTLQHSKNPYGENIYWAGGFEPTAEDVVQSWASEKENYNYADNSCDGTCGHYTQVVWRNSDRLGCGQASCGGSEVWVCNYNPPGNYVGEKPY